MLRVVLAIPLLFASVLPAFAQSPDELAGAARKVLKKHCLACHNGEGSTSGEAFDVLNHASLLKEKGEGEKPILKGKTLDSRLWVRAGEAKSMPPKSVKERPTAEEIESLKKWIEAGAPPFPTSKPRAYISTVDAFQRIYEHLNNSAADDQPYLRYFTLTHLHNDPSVDDEALRMQKAALSKAINSMTRAPRMTLPKAIDREETTYVIDLRDYDWHKNRVWNEVLAQYPYGLDYKGSDDTKLIDLQKKLDKLTRGELFYLRADWFVATATRPPLYYTLLQLPETSHELKKWLQVDSQHNFQTNKLARAGFQASGISAQNRMVERHDSPVGIYYWESYDFKPRKAKANLTRFPLGPAFPKNDFPRQAFDHDGGEMIYGLPNGLQGYFLTDAKGKRIDAGPLDVVNDPLKTSGSPAIVSGVSCMNCHKYGMMGFTDTIRDGNGLFGDGREKVLKLYPEAKVMEELLKADEERFLKGLEKAIGPFLKVGEDAKRPIRDFGEPVGEVTRAYLHVDVSLDKAAFELGIPKGETLAGMIKGNQQLRGIGVLPLANGKVLKRDDWEAPDGTSLFQDVASALGLGTPIMPRR